MIIECNATGIQSILTSLALICSLPVHAADSGTLQLRSTYIGTGTCITYITLLYQVLKYNKLRHQQQPSGGVFITPRSLLFDAGTGLQMLMVNNLWVKACST